MITALVFSALLGAAGEPPAPPSGQTQGQVTAPAAKPVKTDDKDRMVCHREDSETGSHRVMKICHTKREWDQMTEDAQRLFREGGIQAVGSLPAGGDGAHAPIGGGGGGPH
ncbi:MAG TPA: hypothetical protein VGL66_12770 [Caulobacteraceae bacterium]|jgi:hypothetical protein